MTTLILTLTLTESDVLNFNDFEFGGLAINDTITENNGFMNEESFGIPEAWNLDPQNEEISRNSSSFTQLAGCNNNNSAPNSRYTDNVRTSHSYSNSDVSSLSPQLSRNSQRPMSLKLNQSRPQSSDRSGTYENDRYTYGNAYAGQTHHSYYGREDGHHSGQSSYPTSPYGGHHSDNHQAHASQESFTYNQEHHQYNSVHGTRQQQYNPSSRKHRGMGDRMGGNSTTPNLHRNSGGYPNSGMSGGSNAQGRAINKLLLEILRERVVDPQRLDHVIENHTERMDCVNVATLLFHTGKKRLMLSPQCIKRIAARMNVLKEELRSREASNALYGLKCMCSEIPEVRQLVMALANKIASSSSEFVAQAVGNALYGE